MKQYKNQPSIQQFLKDNPSCSRSDYDTMFKGKYRGHIKRLKSMFNNPKLKQEKQVTSHMAKKILSPTDKGGWTTSDAWAEKAF